MELLVVVALIALMGGTGMGMYASSQKRMQLEKAARDLVLTAQYGRIMAIEQQMPFSIEFDTETNSFALTAAQWDPESGESAKIVIDDYYCKPVQMAAHVQLEEFMVGSTQVDMSSSSMEAAKDEDTSGVIRFLPNGTADEAVIQLGDGNVHYTVSIRANTGKATVIFGTAEMIESKVMDLDEQR